ncbi:MAG: serine/threonine protein kinase, partial [Labilithrix sp.]|nr:serine/threonine protein kinase [Labilithrix sp.]
MDRDLAAGWRVGRYMVFRPIAAGGMATVHLGRLIGAGGFSRTVAVKRLFDAYASDPEFVSMLLDEARLVAVIRHPNVVPTLDVVAENAELLVVMEYVEGETVANLTRLARDAGERIPVELAASIVAQTLHGLHSAHEARDRNGAPLEIVHRDVSPQNVLVGTDGIARVLDFGIAKAASRSASTEGGQLKGKAAYMAPEHLRYGAVDRRTDVFAASVVLWELLAGRRLFQAEGPAQTVAKILHDPIDSPQRWAPDVPTELALIAMRGLERDPAARFESAEEMALAIEDAIDLPRAREVSAWVTRIAAPSIAERGALIRELERASNPELDMSTTDPVLRAALEEAERRRQFSDLPTDVGRPVHSSGEVQAQWAM